MKRQEPQSPARLRSTSSTRSPNLSAYHRVSESKRSKVTVLNDTSTQTETSTIEKKNSLSKLLKIFTVRAFIAYVLLCFLLCTSGFVQSLFVYLNIIRWPLTNSALTDLHSLGIPHARNLVLKTEDGLHIRGYHVVPLSDFYADTSNPTNFSDAFFNQQLVNSKRIFIFFHGNGLTRAFPFRIQLIKQLSSLLDAHVITFDYRGFGDSEGWPSENGIHLDSRAIFHWLFDTVLGNSTNEALSLPKIYVYGQSFGTAVGTQIVQEINNQQEKRTLPSSSRSEKRKVDGLILDSPFTDLLEAARSHPLAAIFRIFPLMEKLM
jgi:abhydrolase domain-containing protein 12